MAEQKQRGYSEPRRRVSLVGPVILIGLGVVFLLNNMGVLAWSVWDVVFRLWPVLLIAAGLEVILSRLSPWGSLLALALTVVVFASALWLLGSDIRTGRAATGEEIRQALGEATRARVVIEPAVGSVHIEALSESANLVEGTVRLGKGQTIKRHFAIAGDTATLTLQSGGTTFDPFLGWDDDRGWELGLAPEVLLGLEVNLAAGRADLDLTDVSVSDLKVTMGLGQITVTLPAEGRFYAQLEGAVGEIVVDIPAGMSARIRVASGLAVRELPDSYQQWDDVYTSPGYDSTDNRADLEVSQPIGKITIRQSGTW